MERALKLNATYPLLQPYFFRWPQTDHLPGHPTMSTGQVAFYNHLANSQRSFLPNDLHPIPPISLAPTQEQVTLDPVSEKSTIHNA